MYFEGLKGIKQVLEYKQKESKGKELVGFYATSKGLPKELTEYFDEWNEKNRKLGITTRGIVPDHESLTVFRNSDKEFGREMKVMPYDEFSSEVAIDVSGDVVRIQDYKNLQGVAIEKRGCGEDHARDIRDGVERGRSLDRGV